ncbi:MAG: hypothetical protein QWI36_03025 [Wolbachia endosymbiont of Tyrophagus putrescentiae]|nr:hypothetical protein [Wolbachia endosymbiont of Tyrophagus putrescentiae]
MTKDENTVDTDQSSSSAHKKSVTFNDLSSNAREIEISIVSNEISEENRAIEYIHEEETSHDKLFSGVVGAAIIMSIAYFAEAPIAVLIIAPILGAIIGSSIVKFYEKVCKEEGRVSTQIALENVVSHNIEHQRS